MFVVRTLRDAEIAIQEIEQTLDAIRANWDRKGFRITNTGASRASGDVVVRKELTTTEQRILDELNVLKTAIRKLENRVSTLE